MSRVVRASRPDSVRPGWPDYAVGAPESPGLSALCCSAWGVPDADSDFDLYLIVPDGSEPAHRAARRGHLALRAVGVPVDLLIRTRSESAPTN